MKKIFKSKIIQNVLFFILGAVIFGEIGVVATTYVLQANEIQYKDNKSVQQAIDELYELAKNGGSGIQTLTIGTATVDGYKITVPYTGNYPNVRCVYGSDENYGSVGTISDNACIFYGLSANQTFYYKIVATDNVGKFYENNGNVEIVETPISANVNLGDYIYLKPTSTSYSLYSNMTGCGYTGASYDACNYNGKQNKAQTINPSELTVWRVIKKNEDGTVDVVSDKVSSSPVYFGGSEGYDKFINTLNTISAQYTNSSFVKNTRYMETNDISLVNNVYGTLKSYVVNGTSYGAYWLPSRYSEAGKDSYFDDYDDLVYCDVYSYYVGYVDSNGISKTGNKGFLIYKDEEDCGWGSDLYETRYSFRPILTLKSTTKISGGTGTASDNYQLSV